MASLLTRIETFLLALSGRKETEPELKSRLALTILLSAFGLVLIVLFSVIQVLGGLWWVAATNQISTLFFVVILALLRHRHGYAARIALLFYANCAIVFYSYLFGHDIGLKFLLYPLMVTPFVLFMPGESTAILGLAFLSMVLSIVMNAYGAAWMPGIVALPSSTKTAMQAGYSAFAPIAFFAPTAFLLGAMKRYERRQQADQVAVLQLAKLSALGDMAGGLAHEVNNPLQIIEGYTRILRARHGSLAGPSFEQDLVPIEDAAKRISRVVAAFRAFSAESHEPDAKRIDLSSVIKQVLNLSRERFHERQIELIEPNTDEELIVNGDRIRLGDALFTLLNNAYDATQGQGGWVKVSTVKSDGRIAVLVEDSGPGVPVAIRSRLFEPFFTTKPPGQGLGLGLTVAYSTLRRHGGELYFDRDATHTRFVMKLALAG